MIAKFRDNVTKLFNRNHRKEKHFTYQFTATVVDKETMQAYEATILRIYNTQGRSYACIWVKSNCSWDNALPFWREGSGWAGGYGYNRESAAAENAIANCGIILDEYIGGRGLSKVEEAVEAITRQLWTNNYRYHIYISKANA